MPRLRWSKRRVASSGYVAIRPLCRFGAAGAVKWSMNALACAIPTMRISIEGRGKVVRSAAISGRQEITNSMRRTPSIGPDIERGKPVSSGPNHGHENCPPEGSFRHPTSSHSQRVNVLGFLKRNNEFVPYMIDGKVDASVIVKCFDQFSQQLDKKTYVFIDNAPMHRVAPHLTVVPTPPLNQALERM